MTFFFLFPNLGSYSVFCLGGGGGGPERRVWAFLGFFEIFWRSPGPFSGPFGGPLGVFRV